MRILHLAYEDPRQPGSGGGSVRTFEINRRLAARHEITAVVTGYPGARERIEDGIHWLPIGTRFGGKIDRLSYFALLGSQVLIHRYDLVVEDFGAPFSIGLSPLFTTRPVIGSVQWLFAAEMRRKYGLPFDWIEKSGLRFYKNLIAVSAWLQQRLASHNPAADCIVIPEGVDSLAYSVESKSPSHLLYVGRLDTKQKGCDLLMEIMARVEASLGNRAPKLVVVGDGPDETAIKRYAEQLGISSMLEFRGRVEGRPKYQLMADSYAVLMPSRFETFGMVAAESQAVGTPLVAFDVGPLAEVAGPGGARLVKPFDVEAFAQEVIGAVIDRTQADHQRQVSREWARRYDWDQISATQETYYHQVVASSR